MVGPFLSTVLYQIIANGMATASDLATVIVVAVVVVVVEVVVVVVVVVVLV